MKPKPIKLKSNRVNPIKIARPNMTYMAEKSKGDILRKDINSRSRIMDKIDSSPHYTLHLFHNVKRNKFYVTYENGIKLPIEYNNDLSREEQGVYIIIRYRVPNVVNADIKGLTDYYDNEEVTLDEKVTDDICTLLSQGRNDDLAPVSRFMKFVPMDMLLDHGHVLDPDNRLVISHNMIDIIYPVKDDYPIDMDDSMISVLIFNSESSGKVYYSNSFGVVRKIISDNNLLGDYCMITYTVNNVKKRIEVPLDRLSEVGIYETREEALSHGDLDSYIQLAKFNHSMMTMDAELKIKVVELRSKIELSNLAIEDKKLALELLEEKIRMEKIKSEGVRHKAMIDSSANSIKRVGMFGDIVSGVGKIVSKVI